MWSRSGDRTGNNRKVEDVLEACVDAMEGKREGMSLRREAAEMLGTWQFSQILETSRMWLGVGPLGGRGTIYIVYELQRGMSMHFEAFFCSQSDEKNWQPLHFPPLCPG